MTRTKASLKQTNKLSWLKSKGWSFSWSPHITLGSRTHYSPQHNRLMQTSQYSDHKTNPGRNFLKTDLWHQTGRLLPGLSFICHVNCILYSDYMKSDISLVDIIIFKNYISNAQYWHRKIRRICKYPQSMCTHVFHPHAMCCTREALRCFHCGDCAHFHYKMSRRYETTLYF